ncbi:ABC transporter ATP-binding protein [Arsenicicoccus piscis]|uniref:ABC transporter ATP-binding protein n=1 Tax=Arsenicicoccus piscis TaxID=673954 RepID=UPI001F4C5D0D|nr:ABC transporter ATP-binding protein [Arsenicicoccus piscis]MCH8627222.1 ABC transporter ATP-binding protein [Arsenicicoccus piscis]
MKHTSPTRSDQRPDQRPDQQGLVARDLVKSYGPRRADRVPALGGVDLALAPGESVAVMGPSGSGKTTLLHVLSGILAPTSGWVRWQGRELSSMSDRERTRLRRTDFGFVFQSGQLLPELTAVENVALPLLLAGQSRATAWPRAEATLRSLGLGDLSTRRPGALSGGQAQRVAIARALVGSPGVVFADEPTGALDSHTGQQVMSTLTQHCAAQGATLVVVTHDAAVAGWCQRLVHMRDGLIERLEDQSARAGRVAQPAPSVQPAHAAQPAEAIVR